MRLKSFSKKDWSILIILLAILGVAAAIFGSRGIFMGVILLYINASIDIIQQIINRFKLGQTKSAISNLLAFCIISFGLIAIFLQWLW